MFKTHHRVMHCCFTFLVVATVSAPIAKANNSIVMRCREEPLTIEQARGRTAWAARCGYIEADYVPTFNAMQLFPIFSDIVAPVDANAPCLGPQAFLGACLAGGCYLPGQRVMFDKRYLPIEEAAMSSVATVTSLPVGWEVGDVIDHAEQPIDYFMAGDEDHDVYTIETADGKAIRVTHTHPLVTEDGDIITAEAIVPGGAALYTEDGPSAVVSVRTSPYASVVWNVAPAAEASLANILFAEGFLTGSARFQNEWADDMARLSLRDQATAIVY